MVNVTPDMTRASSAAVQCMHFMQVSKWLGHSSYVLTLTTYADYIPEQETDNPLPEPVAPASVDTGNVVNLHRSTAG